jgi:zinc D-Ala-D-Ala carboxypeptidase
MNITNHVSLKEVSKSHTAIKNGIDNIPTGAHLLNIKELCYHVFEPLREWVGGAIKINSGFRSEALNNIIGGAKSSQHLANNGAAFDIDDTFGHKTNKEMFEYIKDNLPYDQLIWEFGTNNNPDWIHVSYKVTDNRREILYAKKNSKGKTYYENY